MRQEPAIGRQEIRTGTAACEEAQIGADDIRLRRGKGRTAERVFEVSGGGNQKAQVSTREGLDRRIGDRRLHPVGGAEDVPRSTGRGKRVSKRDRQADLLCRDRAGAPTHRHDRVACDRTAVSSVDRVGRGLCAVRYDPADGSSARGRKHVSHLEPA